MPEENFYFPETKKSFKYEWLLLFLWLCYFPCYDASYCLSCVLFGHDFPPKASPVKNLFSQPFRAWESAVSYFRTHCKDKRKKTYPLHESFKAFIFQHGLKLKQIKGSRHEINLLCENTNMRLKKTVKY